MIPAEKLACPQVSFNNFQIFSKAMEEKQYTSYEFGPYCLLPFERLLLRDNKPLPLTPRVFDTLLAFVQNSGRLLSKDELMTMVWGETIVEESNLTQNIFVLRK